MSNFVRLTTKPIRRFGTHMEDTDGHNLRTIPEMCNTADPTKTHLNEHLAGDPDEGLRSSIYERIDEAGVKVPKNATVIAQELTLGASPEYFRPEYHPDDDAGHGVYDQERMEVWRDATMEYLNEKYGKKNIVSAVLHLDERTPHIHAIVLPITEVTKKKRRTQEQIKNGEPNDEYTTTGWNRQKVFGKKSHYQMQEDYGQWMEKIGLQRGIPKKITRMKNKEVIEWHKQRNKTVAEEQTKRTSFEMSVPTIRKKKVFESTKDYIAELLESFKKSNEENRKRFNKELREAEDARFKAQQIATEQAKKNYQLRQKMGVLSHYKHDELVEALDYLEKHKEQEKSLKNENKKTRTKTFSIS